MRLVLLAVTVALLVPAWFASERLTFDQSIESLYAASDPNLENYLESKRLFGGDEFVIVAWREPQLFQPDSTDLTAESSERIEAFAETLSKIPGVQSESTQDLASTKRGREIEFTIFYTKRRFVPPIPQKKLHNLVRGMLLGREGESVTAVIVRLTPEDDARVPREQTFREIRSRAAEFAAEQGLPTYVVGEPLQVHDMFRIVERDGWRLFWISLGVLAVVLGLLFRRPRWILLPLVVVVATILFTRALLVVSGMQLSMVSSMLNSMATIIGIATVMHVTVYYRETRKSYERLDAFRETMVVLLPAIFLTCATTAVGFLALLSSQISPAQSFGKMMALASGMVFVTCLAILPAGILLGRRTPDPGEAPAERRLSRLLGRLSDWVERYPKWLGASAFLVSAVAFAGLFRLQIETDFSANFRQDSHIVESLKFVESNLGGAGTWEVNFPAPEELTEEYIDHVRRFADRLETEITDEAGEPRLKKVLAVSEAVDMVPSDGLYALAIRSVEQRIDIVNQLQPEFAPTLYNAKHHRMRIMLRALERQSSEDKLNLIARVEEIAREEFPPGEYPGSEPPKATGLFVLLAHIIESLLSDQLVSFAWATAGIFVMMTVAFRSVRIGLISLLPNIFPIVLVIGAMGWSGLRVNIATAMIASVSMGLTVDSTIHYISAYRRHRRTMGVFDALRASHQGVGRALVFANIALMIGFYVLTLSEFIPLVYFGMLLSVAMFGGLLADLILLPLLLRWVDRAEIENEPTPA